MRQPSGPQCGDDGASQICILWEKYELFRTRAIGAGGPYDEFADESLFDGRRSISAFSLTILSLSRLVWQGLSLSIVVVAVLSAIWFFLTAQQLNDRLQEVGGSARGEHQQLNSRPDKNG